MYLELLPGASFFVFRTEAGAKRKRLVAKRKGPWEGERQEACFPHPALLCAQIFIARETYGYEAGTPSQAHIE